MKENSAKFLQNINLTEHQKEHLDDAEKKRKSTKYCDDINIALNKFRTTIKAGPNNACVSCCKLLFRRTVIIFNKNRYEKSPIHLIETILASEPNTCSHDKLYICHQYYICFKKNQVQVLCSVNGLL